MATARRVATGVVAVAAVGLLAGCGATAFTPVDESERPLAAVYRGPAACDGCPEAAASLLQRAGGFSVVFIGPGEELDVNADDLQAVTLYVQPGGFDDVEQALDHLGEEAPAALEHWVNDGGRYLGFCMGAYLAGSNPGMGLLAPGDTEGYSGTAGALVSDAGEAVIRVDWEGETRYQYAQDPAVIVESGVDGEKVLSRFTNGQVNALVRPVGDGAVGVVGTHPEAEADWFTPEMAEADIDGLDHDQALELVEALLEVR